MKDVAELDARSKALRDQAGDLLDSGLLSILQARFGSAEIVGSVDLDLMTWRDIDICVPVDRAEKPSFVTLLPDIVLSLESAGHWVVRAVLNDEWAAPRGDYGSGYYCGMRVLTAAEETWKIDIWGWAAADHRSKVDEHLQLKAALAAADRDLILQLKAEAMELPEFRKSITSYDIYRLVLNDQGTSTVSLASGSRPGKSSV